MSTLQAIALVCGTVGYIGIVYLLTGWTIQYVTTLFNR